MISKVLCNKLKPILKMIISEVQSDFVPYRLISDTVMVGYDCIDFITNKRNGKKGCVAIKLDMSKAYDRVEWCFLKKVMTQMGFVDQRITIIIDCISTVSFPVVLNGE